VLRGNVGILLFGDEGERKFAQVDGNGQSSFHVKTDESLAYINMQSHGTN